MENVAKEAGAELIEPLWGEDPVELFFEEMDTGITSLIIDVENPLAEWAGVELNRENATRFVEDCLSRNMDPLGENGEYHTLVTNSPLHESRLSYKIIEKKNYWKTRCSEGYIK